MPSISRRELNNGPGQNIGAADRSRPIHSGDFSHRQYHKHRNQVEHHLMLVQTKNRMDLLPAVDRWPTSGDYSAVNWKASTVTLQHIFLGDPAKKIRDAIHNTSDADLVAGFGATNRLICYYRQDNDVDNDEIDHQEIRKNLMENELCIRLRAGRVKQ